MSMGEVKTFIHSLRYHRLTSQQRKTLRGQALEGIHVMDLYPEWITPSLFTIIYYQKQCRNTTEEYTNIEQFMEEFDGLQAQPE